MCGAENHIDGANLGGFAGAANAALGSDLDAVAHAAHFLQHLAEDPFGSALTVDVRVIKQSVTGFVGCDYGTTTI